MKCYDVVSSAVSPRVLSPRSHSLRNGLNKRARTASFWKDRRPGNHTRAKCSLRCRRTPTTSLCRAAGTVAKLIEEGYTGYLVRATNDDMGDELGLGTAGMIGENVLGNERDNEEVARVLGCKWTFNLNYNNHRMADVSPE